MSHFLMAFDEIDADGSGEITIPELRRYMSEQDYEDSFVQKFLSVFDINGDGSITLAEYCQTLGIRPKSDKTGSLKRGSYLQRDGQLRGRELLIIDEDMPQPKQTSVLRKARAAMENHSKDDDIAEDLKRQLDVEFGRAWHVVVGHGPFGSFISNETESLFHFRLDSTAFLVWKTPDF